MKAPDMFGSLVAIGITALVGIQVIINIAVVTSSMPATGMPLPFFSYRRNSIIYITVPDGSFTEYIESKCEVGKITKEGKGDALFFPLKIFPIKKFPIGKK